jgi:hypothetical protein
MVVRKSGTLRGVETAGFVDAAEFERLKRSPSGIKRWIDGQLQGTSVTVVLVGQATCSSDWVRYEIDYRRKRPTRPQGRPQI